MPNSKILYRGSGKAKVQRDIEHKASEKSKPLSELLGEPEPTTEGYDEMARRLRALDKRHQVNQIKQAQSNYGGWTFCKADGATMPCLDRRILDGGTK